MPSSAWKKTQGLQDSLWNSLCWIANQVNPLSTNRAHLISLALWKFICKNSFRRVTHACFNILTTTTKKHAKLNTPHREVPFDILTIWSAITARLCNRTEKSGIRIATDVSLLFPAVVTGLRSAYEWVSNAYRPGRRLNTKLCSAWFLN